MFPITEVFPKPLVPVGDHTMIEEVINQFYGHDITIIVNYMGDLIEAYLKDKEYKFITEGSYGGTVGALKKLTINEDFILTNCDILVKEDYRKMMKEHKERKADMTIVATRHIERYPYGTFDYDKDNRVLSIIEKPTITNVINTGFYIINPGMIELIDKDYMDMDKLIQLGLDKNKNIYLHHIHNEKYVDMGTLNRYKEFMKGLE